MVWQAFDKSIGMIMGPAVVSISITGNSDMKAFYILCGIKFLKAMAVPPSFPPQIFFVCVLLPDIFIDWWSGVP